jgi:SAM-dependent methyltransferase
MSMQNVTNMWHQSLYRNALWEYALAYKAIGRWFGNSSDLRFADYGYGLGLPPLLYWLGYDITLVEIWRRMPSEENYLLEHLRRVKERRTVCAGQLSIWPKTVGTNGLPEEKKFDAVFCTSMMQKLGSPEIVFRDLCSLVKKDGLLFLTTSEEDREIKIREFTKEMYGKFLDMGLSNGFRLLEDEADWEWNGRENSFVSLVMVKEKE